MSQPKFQLTTVLLTALAQTIKDAIPLTHTLRTADSLKDVLIPALEEFGEVLRNDLCASFPKESSKNKAWKLLHTDKSTGDYRHSFLLTLFNGSKKCFSMELHFQSGSKILAANRFKIIVNSYIWKTKSEDVKDVAKLIEGSLCDFLSGSHPLNGSHPVTSENAEKDSAPNKKESFSAHPDVLNKNIDLSKEALELANNHAIVGNSMLVHKLVVTGIGIDKKWMRVCAYGAIQDTLLKGSENYHPSFKGNIEDEKSMKKLAKKLAKESTFMQAVAKEFDTWESIRRQDEVEEFCLDFYAYDCFDWLKKQKVLA